MWPLAAGISARRHSGRHDASESRVFSKVPLRTEFRDTAAWAPAVWTGEAGEATVVKDPAKIEELAIIEKTELAELRSFFANLKASAEEGQNLLDRTMVLYGSNLGNSSSHDTRNMPIVLAGGGFKHGQHLAFDPVNNTPLCNLYVQMLQRLGVDTSAFGSAKAASIPGFEAA